MEAKLLTADRFVDARTGCSYRYVHSNTEYFRPHYHDYYEIFIPLDGEAKHIVNGTQVELKKGCAVFIRPHDTHDYVCENGASYSMLNINFTQETANAVFDFLGAGFKVNRLLEAELPPSVSLDEGEFEFLFSRMSEITSISEGDAERLKTELRALLFWLISVCFKRFRSSSDSSAPEWLTELRKALKNDGNFINGVSVIPSLCSKSREHIARCMKKHYGVSVSEYVNGLRLNYIANMLRHSDRNILDIVYESGFNNVSWANNCFYKKYGCTMSAYRKHPQYNNDRGN